MFSFAKSVPKYKEIRLAGKKELRGVIVDMLGSLRYHGEQDKFQSTHECEWWLFAIPLEYSSI